MKQSYLFWRLQKLLQIIDQAGEDLHTLANSGHESRKYKYPFTLNSDDFKTLDQVYNRLTIDDRDETRRIILQ